MYPIMFVLWIFIAYPICQQGISLGIFLSSGIQAVGLFAQIDFLIVSLIIMYLEENELQQRFGDEYRSYMIRVPRFIPRLSKQAKTEEGDKLTDTGNSSKLA